MLHVQRKIAKKGFRCDKCSNYINKNEKFTLIKSQYLALEEKITNVCLSCETEEELYDIENIAQTLDDEIDCVQRIIGI